MHFAVNSQIPEKNEFRLDLTRNKSYTNRIVFMSLSSPFLQFRATIYINIYQCLLWLIQRCNINRFFSFCLFSIFPFISLSCFFSSSFFLLRMFLTLLYSTSPFSFLPFLWYSLFSLFFCFFFPYDYASFLFILPAFLEFSHVQQAAI